MENNIHYGSADTARQDSSPTTDIREMKTVIDSYVPFTETEEICLLNNGFTQNVIEQISDWGIISSLGQLPKEAALVVCENKMVYVRLTHNGNARSRNSTLAIITNNSLETFKSLYRYGDVSNGRNVPLMEFVNMALKKHLVTNHIRCVPMVFKEENRDFLNKNAYIDASGDAERTYVTTYVKLGNPEEIWVKINNALSTLLEFAFSEEVIKSIPSNLLKSGDKIYVDTSGW